MEISTEKLEKLIKIEAIKLLTASSERKMDFINRCYSDWKPSYPYGQFNKLPNELYSAFEKDVETLKNIHSTKLNEYLEKHGKEGFMRVVKTKYI